MAWRETYILGSHLIKRYGSSRLYSCQKISVLAWWSLKSAVVQWISGLHCYQTKHKTSSPNCAICKRLELSLRIKNCKNKTWCHIKKSSPISLSQKRKKLNNSCCVKWIILLCHTQFRRDQYKWKHTSNEQKLLKNHLKTYIEYMSIKVPNTPTKLLLS